VAYLGFSKGGMAWRARWARAYNGGLGAESPQRGAPGGEWGGEAP